jgi:hypothetical protein
MPVVYSPFCHGPVANPHVALFPGLQRGAIKAEADRNQK